MITIAIDASTKSTGIAMFKDNQLLGYENFVSSNKNVLKRIKYMTDKIEEIYKKNNQESVQVVMEQVIPDNLNDAKWTRNQATFKALFYLQAAIVLMFDHYDDLDVNDDVADAICLGHGKIHHEPEPAAFNWED